LEAGTPREKYQGKGLVAQKEGAAGKSSFVGGGGKEASQLTEEKKKNDKDGKIPDEGGSPVLPTGRRNGKRKKPWRNGVTRECWPGLEKRWGLEGRAAAVSRGERGAGGGGNRHKSSNFLRRRTPLSGERGKKDTKIFPKWKRRGVGEKGK